MATSIDTRQIEPQIPGFDVLITRYFQAPRALVWKAWTDPVHLARWWGPHDFKAPVSEIPGKKGAALRIVMRGPDGKDHPLQGEVIEAIENERLVYSIKAAERESWGDVVPPDAVHIILFEDHNGGTKMSVIARLETEERRDFIIQVGFEQGMGQSLDKMAGLLADVDQVFALERVFDAPPALVWKAWTDPAHLARWFGPKGIEIEVKRFDFRPGGEFFYAMKMPMLPAVHGKFVYRFIMAPHCMDYVVSFTDANANPVRHPMSATWPLEVLTRLEFHEEAGGKTRLKSRSWPTNALEGDIRTFALGKPGMTQGTVGMLDQLATYLATLK